MVLTAASPRTVKYRQIHQKILQLETMVKDKDAELLHTPENPVERCLYTAVTCFKKGIQKLQPASSQESSQFTKAIRIVNKFTYRDPGKRDMENEKYTNLKNGGKTNTPANFSIAFASTAKFVMNKVQRSKNTDMMCKVIIFGSIAAAILLTAAYGVPVEKTKIEALLRASLSDLDLLKGIDNNSLDFYTPNDKWECNHTTLACFLKELKVLEQDVDEKDKQHVKNIMKNLEDLQDPGFSNPTCKTCEVNGKKKFPEFHKEMTGFLRSMLKQNV
ncbi:hypothetical protein HGM15179_013858 [Zosterops borbonicus]|uniref:Interleukin n=1 Tax=Zosterops borbonicus TaxID=364589 RepID=A0A8K1LGL3_9PASS|nr:hypothetical protein HGM15179_013858 [Zosterops borbonicus]